MAIWSVEFVGRNINKTYLLSLILIRFAEDSCINNILVTYKWFPQAFGLIPNLSSGEHFRLSDINKNQLREICNQKYTILIFCLENLLEIFRYVCSCYVSVLPGYFLGLAVWCNRVNDVSQFGNLATIDNLRDNFPKCFLNWFFEFTKKNCLMKKIIKSC